jgi:hypothetical protein
VSLDLDTGSRAREVENCCEELAGVRSGRQLQAQAHEARRRAQSAVIAVAARRLGLLPLPDERLQPERELQRELLFFVVLMILVSLLLAAGWRRVALRLGLGLWLGLAHVGVGMGSRLHVGVLLRPLQAVVVVVVVVVAAGGLLAVLDNHGHRLLFCPLPVLAERRALTAAGLVGLGGGARRRGALAAAAEEDDVGRGGGVPGDVADVVAAGSEQQRRRGVGRGVDLHLHDGVALEHGLDGGLARLPLARPEQADGAVDRVDDAAARLVEQGAEGGGAEVVGGRRGQQVEQPRPAVELGEEDGGVGLRLGGLDPLQAGADGAGVAAALAQDAAAVAAHPHLRSSDW